MRRPCNSRRKHRLVRSSDTQVISCAACGLKLAILYCVRGLPTVLVALFSDVIGKTAGSTAALSCQFNYEHVCDAALRVAPDQQLLVMCTLGCSFSTCRHKPGSVIGFAMVASASAPGRRICSLPH